MNISEYDYDLPLEKIVNRPNEKRGTSKLLVYENRQIVDSSFLYIDSFFQPGDVLVLNNTRVFSARIPVKKESGGRAEILLTNPQSHDADYNLAMSAKGRSTWEAIIGGKRINQGQTLRLLSGEFNFAAKVIKKEGMNATVELSYDQDIDLITILPNIGKIPLPPYMNRQADDRDNTDYQTVFAKHTGSVAAPTASLHYTDEILDRIREKGVNVIELTLHVGPGTFLPMTSDDPEKHDMHSERIEISSESLVKLSEAIKSNKRIIASGTTALRSLESWIVLVLSKVNLDRKYYQIPQWPKNYSETSAIPLKTIREEIAKGFQELSAHNSVKADTKLMIVPDHPFFIVSGIITNFHLPKSTLLMLVSAFIGKEQMWQIYDHALNHNYRFLSYGDASLLFRNP